MLGAAVLAAIIVRISFVNIRALMTTITYHLAAIKPHTHGLDIKRGRNVTQFTYQDPQEDLQTPQETGMGGEGGICSSSASLKAG